MQGVSFQALEGLEIKEGIHGDTSQRGDFGYT